MLFSIVSRNLAVNYLRQYISSVLAFWTVEQSEGTDQLNEAWKLCISLCLFESEE